MAKPARWSSTQCEGENMCADIAVGFSEDTFSTSVTDAP